MSEDLDLLEDMFIRRTGSAQRFRTKHLSGSWKLDSIWTSKEQETRRVCVCVCVCVCACVCVLMLLG